MKSSRQRMMISILTLAMVATCALAFQKMPTTPQALEKAKQGTVVLNITCGPEDVFRLLRAFHVAEDAINDGRHVVLFFNGRGVTVPVKRLSAELQLGQERSLWVVLHDLVRSGAEVLVSRESIRTLNMVEADFIPETQFGAWGGSVFCKVDFNTTVFSY